VRGDSIRFFRRLAKAEKVNESYLSRILRLTLIAPEITEAKVASSRSRSKLLVAST
jgi:hypothetical protein